MTSTTVIYRVRFAGKLVIAHPHTTGSNVRYGQLNRFIQAYNYCQKAYSSDD